ncbi:MAG: DNA translocase FtsK 4TM domain-containing protein, partial [Tenuifilaceae bacterium]
MAKVGNDSKTKKNEGKPKRSFFKDDRIRFTFGLLVLFFSLYLTIAFVSYLFSWQSDQSFQWQSIFSDSSVRVHNWAGKVGASFASQFLNRWFGIASFAIPFLIGIIGLRLLKIRLLPLRSTILKSLLGMVLVSLLFGFLFGNAGNILGSGLGGAHGLFISEWLIAFVGKSGTLFLLIVVCTAYLLYLNVSILPLYKRIALAVISLFKISPNNKDDGTDKTFSELDGKDDQSHSADSTQDENERTDMEPFSVLKSDNVDDYEEDDSAGGIKDDELDDDVEDSDETNRIATTDDVEMEVNINLEENGDQQVIVTPEFYDPTKELSAYQLPPIELLEDYRHRQAPVTEE